MDAPQAWSAVGRSKRSAIGIHGKTVSARHHVRTPVSVFRGVVISSGGRADTHNLGTLVGDKPDFGMFSEAGEHVNQHQDTFVLLVKRRAIIRLLRSMHAPHPGDIGGSTAFDDRSAA
jgi:hypothetical protein